MRTVFAGIATTWTLLAAAFVGLPGAGWSQAPDSQTKVPSLTDAEVLAAIALGRSTKERFALEVVTTVGRRDLGHLEYRLLLQGPFGRIASAAATSARNRQPFTPDDVTDEMRAPQLVVEARPIQYESLGDSLQIIAPATLVLLRGRYHGNPGDTGSIEPVRIRVYAVSQGNSRGGRLRGQGITAYFALDSVPADDFEIVVIAGGREYRRMIGRKDRDKVR